MDDEAELAERMEKLAQQLTGCQGQMDTLRDIFERYQREKSRKSASWSVKVKKRKKLMKARQELDLANRALQEFHGSVFWKMTKPLRFWWIY